MYRVSNPFHDSYATMAASAVHQTQRTMYANWSDGRVGPTPRRRVSKPLHHDSRPSRRLRKLRTRFSDFLFFLQTVCPSTDVESTSSTWLTAFRVVGCQRNRETPDSKVQNAHGTGAAGARQGRSQGLIRPAMLLCRGVA